MRHHEISSKTVPSCIQANLESQRHKEPFQVNLDLGSHAPPAQPTDSLPKGRLQALLPACRYISV